LRGHVHQRAQQCKVADFGLSRNTAGKDYYRRNAVSAPIPVRWVAIETLKYDVSTLASDRWSFGIVMWEIFTFGERPYAGLQNNEILAHIDTGKRVRRPDGCPDTVHTLMQHCWSVEPEQRPPFKGRTGMAATLLALHLAGSTTA